VLDAARPDARLQLYNNTILTLWLVTIACTVLWVMSGMSLRELGLRLGEGWRFWLSWSVVGLAAGYMIISVLQVRFSPKARAAMRQQLGQAGDLGLIHPETPREHGRFTWLAITAGITEEVLFRGFLIGVFALVFPLWLAALFAAGLFVLGHAYQGLRGMMRTLPITAILTLVYVVGDSLWPAITLHILCDVAAGALFRVSAHRAVTDATT
jgi:membrane protease YdiL (CAAX protease family)